MRQKAESSLSKYPGRLPPEWRAGIEAAEGASTSEARGMGILEDRTTRPVLSSGWRAGKRSIGVVEELRGERHGRRDLDNEMGDGRTARHDSRRDISRVAAARTPKGGRRGGSNAIAGGEAPVSAAAQGGPSQRRVGRTRAGLGLSRGHGGRSVARRRAVRAVSLSRCGGLPWGVRR